MLLSRACRFCTDSKSFQSLCPAWLQPLALEQQNLANQLPPLQVLEIFCGAGALHRACLAAGLPSRGIDFLAGSGEDLLTLPGFLLAVRLILSVRDRGLVWFAPPCSLWTFLSSSVHGRKASNFWEGDLENPDVVQSNNLAHIVAGLIRLAAARGLAVVVEQPTDSAFFRYGCVRKAMEMIGAQQIVTYLSAFDPDFPCPKALTLRGTPKWLGALFRVRPDRLFETDKVWRRDEAGRVTGGPGLAETSAYPWEFGVAVPVLVLSKAFAAIFFIFAFMTVVLFFRCCPEVATSILRVGSSSHACHPHKCLEGWEQRGSLAEMAADEDSEAVISFRPF